MVMTMPSPIHSHPMSELDIELADLLESLSLQQRIRADRDKRASTHRTHRIRHPYERRRELPIRHYGLLKFLRRASLTRGRGSSSSSSSYDAAALRTPGIPHAFLRSGLGRAPNFMRGVPRADFHPPRGVRRPTLGSRGLPGGVQCARARAGTSGLARR